ncbi:formylglycine-generating enzyme family protein [Oceanidesulfovibrio indonesiensis]|uniref:Formylglycine-generating enzyme family protein n=1 Tax=Oceanidesulfovibrio indonesiensis TaxID=54767 RepID=A0A7M3MB62_9BACT|nr:SUMF1/EgtB/PvdO family nonheme iron enzyme [Oceanidesulfovibrio indonesiensis]TVM15341.1 formylglycine-generating enzyme family protein [Oceanidesulfovibrio indonesiensis]
MQVKAYARVAMVLVGVLLLGGLGESKARAGEISPAAGDTWTEPATGMEFVWVPGGCFDMGSPASEAGRYEDEGPVRNVCVDGFWLGRHEVTNAQYRRFQPEHDSGAFENHTLNNDNQPAVFVSWKDAAKYADWLSAEGASSFRLPTETEWEYAARANTQAARFWGDSPDNACAYANVHDASSKKAFSDMTWEAHACNDGAAVTAPVGSYEANGFGLYDMLGNVWEWTADTYGDDATRADPEKAAEYTAASNRVFRGGSWYAIPRGVRSATRFSKAQDGSDDDLGFRLVRVE